MTKIAPDTATDLYADMAGLLAHLGDSWDAGWTAETLAARVGLSPAEFHRRFHAWTGTSVKRLTQAYAFDTARRALNAGADVLEASLEAGLSGPSRLHDAFIAHEATTPGTAKARGAGLRFVWGVAPTPFGDGVFLIAPRGLSAIGFVDESEEAAFADLHDRYPAASYSRDDIDAARWAHAIFVRRAKVPLALYGTPWQRAVWRALIAIPPNRFSTYGEIAEEVRAPKAARAVGAAVGANPVSILIPCHRVLGKDKRLTGYHWGVERKRTLLTYEALSA